MGREIYKQLKNSKLFINLYSVNFIDIYNYLGCFKYGNLTELINDHVKLLTDCDLLIVLSLRKDRGFLNFENIRPYLKKDCICIKIPQYTFSGYHYPYNF